MQALRVE
ncbi:MAG: Zn-binding dehydrogenase, partial [Porphyrobacter sp. HL-46]